MIEKQFKNLDEQIEILKHRGMTITDNNYTKTVLLRENYFFLNYTIPSRFMATKKQSKIPQKHSEKA